MDEDYRKREIYFSTFTIDQWLPLFGDYPESVKLLYDILDHYVRENLVKIYAFCVMKDHIHLVWELFDYEIDKLEHSFKSYTSKKLITYLMHVEPLYLDNFHSDRNDRKYKIWKLNSKSVHLVHKDIVSQKIQYIHDNPTKGEYFLVENPNDYPYSSAYSYSKLSSQLPFLTLLKDFKNSTK